MIRLENFEKTDFDQLISWVDNDELLTNWAGSLFSFPLTHKSLEWYIENTNDLQRSDAMVYKVVENATNKVVGHISLGALSRKNKSARISRVLIGENTMRGKGLCQKMMQAVLHIGFEQLQLHRIGLGVYDFNKSAIRCYESAGFKKEGLSRDVLLYNNVYWSLWEMSILEEEWRALELNEKK